MKKSFTPLPNPFTAAILAAVLTAALVPATSAGAATITFTIQQGNLQTNGVAYGSGSGYSGVVDGRITDDYAASPLATTSPQTLGNQYRSPSYNGQQYLGLYSYDLTELNNFIAANNSASNAVTIQSVAFQVISAGANASSGGAFVALNLYGTDPFTSSVTWSNYDGTTAWSSPYQTGGSGNYSATGGASALTAQLGSSAPYITITSGNPLTWGTTSAFVGAVQNALARADKKLYLAARPSYFNNGDSRLSAYLSSDTAVANRPQLTVTLQINTSPFTWTGGSGASWATAGNWTSGGVPTSGSQVIFNSSSTAGLTTILGQDFSINNLIVTTPSGPVSIGGANTLTLNAPVGIDLSGANTNLTITAPVALGASQEWIGSQNQTLSVNGGISGAYALTNSGPGTLVLGGASTYSGGTTLNSGGTLIASNAAALGTGTLTLNGGKLDLHLDSSINAYNVVVSGGSTIAGDTATSGNAGITNTFGTLSINASTLSIRSDLDNMLTNSAYGITFSGATTLTGNAAFDVANNGNGVGTLCLGGVVSGSYSLTKQNSGTLLLTNANTYTGSTTISGGTLAISSTGKLYGGTGNTYAVTVNSGATLSLYNWAYAGSLGNNFFVSVRSGTPYPVINGGTITYTGTGAGGGEGTGQANSARIFSIGTAGATLDAEGSGTWYLTANASYDTNSSGVWIGQNIPIGTTLTLAGSSNGRYEKVLSGLGALAKSGAGTWTLAGSTNTYSGGTTINGGSLVPNNTNAIGTGPLTVNSGGVFYPIAASMIFTNPVTLNGSTLRVGGGASHQITYSGSFTTTTTAPNTTNSIVCDGGTGYSVNSDNPGGGNWGAAQFINGNLDMGSNTNTLICSGGDHGGITINGSISGANGTIINTAAELWLANASNSFSGTLRSGVKYVILGYSGANSFYNATLDMNAADSGSFYFQNYPLTIGGLMGSRNLGISGAVSIGNNNADTIYSGALT
ncbi:MAG: autotransporter-associated beta strand repeat-containing protein, partial [Verrucomicrobiae bacterium]